MNILVIDGQGGKIGCKLVESIKKNFPKETITAVGTNSLATAAMLKAGADYGATGENAVIVGCRTANIILGPIGIAIADSLFGEITPKMAIAIGQSMAKRILLPINHCNNFIVGVSDCSLARLIQGTVEETGRTLAE